jgi:nucleoside 2-deoxyribosyltransferase
MKMPRVYLAGPGVFRPDPIAFGKLLKQKCLAAGLDGCFPMDNEDVGGATPTEKARSIYTGNVKLIESAKAIIADISPFRGPNMDPGTAWEIGYGVARGLPIYAWSDDNRTLLDRTPRSGEGDVNGWHIENFGLPENLMIAISSERVHSSADGAIAACAEGLGAKND